MRLVPKNWNRFQHYRNRKPPWIKLHRDLLNDRAFMCLQLASKALAPLLWLLACESDDGSFDADVEELCWRLRMTQSELKSGLDGLLQAGFLLDASTLLAPCLQHATPETEREREERREVLVAPTAETEPKAKRIARPDDVSEQVWQDWLLHRKRKRAAVTATALDGIRREATAAGMTLEAALVHSIAQGWQGFRADWMRANGRAGQPRRKFLESPVELSEWQDPDEQRTA